LDFGQRCSWQRVPPGLERGELLVEFQFPFAQVLAFVLEFRQMHLPAIPPGQILVQCDLALELLVLIVQFHNLGFDVLFPALGTRPERRLLRCDLLGGDF
jgi:hypothetical protein